MSGIIFFKTSQFQSIKDFYQNKLKMKVWLDQGKCMIFSSGNLLLGFCESDKSEVEGTITFFYDNKEEIDKIYVELSDIAKTEPTENPKFKIYHFWAKDIEGRDLEFQIFLHPTEPI